MNGLTRHRLPHRRHHPRLRDSDALRTALWIALAALLGVGLAVTLHLVLGPAPLPARLVDALAFGAVLVLVTAAWQCTRAPEIVALAGAAAIVAAVGLWSAPTALLLSAGASILAWLRIAELRLLGAWAVVALGAALVSLGGG